MQLKGLENVKNVYFIGIGGISMSALAKLLSGCNYSVSGSDAARSEETENLAFYGIKTFVGENASRAELLNADVVVYTDAIPLINKELLASKAYKKRVLSRAELLSIICNNFTNVIAVAGSHGKTTCTSMCAHVLKRCGVPFTAHIGGQDSLFGNFYSSGWEYFITEACEYKKNLLKIPAQTAILLNVDKDHMECYNSENELFDSFRRYCLSARTAFVCADDKRCQELGEFATFGIKNSLADYRAIDLRGNGERYAFTVEEYGRALCRVRLKAIGYCNVYNALAAFAVMRSFGFDEKEIARGLEDFVAVKRRFEKIGCYHGASIICDYAHHPREIASTLATAKKICKGELYVIFQPHTYSRTKLLMKDFMDVLHPIKELVLYKTYPAREEYDPTASAQALAEALACAYVESIYELKTYLKQRAREEDVVLFLGAGDIYYLAQELLRKHN